MLPCVCMRGQVAGLQRTCTRLWDHRRPGPPKLSMMSNHAERGTPVPSPPGQANRKASCWRSGSRRLRKRMPCCNGGDTEWNILGSVRRLTSGGCLVTRARMESVKTGKAIDGLVLEHPVASAKLTARQYREASSACGALHRRVFCRCLSRVMGNYHARF